MYKHYYLVSAIVALAIASGACSGSESKTNIVSKTAEDSTLCESASKAPRLETDSVHWADSLVLGNCSAKASVSGQYPVAGTVPLIDSVRAWLADNLSYSMADSRTPLFKPNAAELAPGSELVERCGKAMLESARSDFKGFAADDISVNYEYSYTFGPSFLTDSLLTYSFSGYVYLGGAHGGALGSGQSFDANSGRKLTAGNIFLSGKQAEVIALLRNELWQQYFKEDSEPGGTLADALLIKPADLQLPVTPPLFGDKGLVFIYQQYEIAPYAAGMPACTLPYNIVKPLMRPEVARLLPN